ncbi:hypothetical protein [Peribacillus sp. CSMR9]|uniref:hypothetical protein n=1 Tax=Peribacillus sp. CSMR9 TaxID=2981350 RepID=UPI002954AA57|nr:hypothetical protein [Peribacillus sp. CSMR9]MDV7766770.1 hypothetical protein [Peribacillus sp. CSMR9]
MDKQQNGAPSIVNIFRQSVVVLPVDFFPLDFFPVDLLPVEVLPVDELPVDLLPVEVLPVEELPDEAAFPFFPFGIQTPPLIRLIL